jgi:ADP-heptose:LPS heptosyltransferase
MKPFDVVQRKIGRCLFIFDHGLGDFILFMPVFKEFIRQTQVNVKLASSTKRQFHLINPSIVNIDNDFNKRQYSYVYRICYPDPQNTSIPIDVSDESSKPYICAVYELGLKEFVWKPYRITNKNFNPNSKRIGVHFFGHTGMDKKFCPVSTAERVWNEIVEAGYEPFEVHMTPKFANEYPDFLEAETLDCINDKCSLRFEEPNLGRMIEEIGKCRFFIGIDSGPVYLASALLGVDHIIGLENQKRHNNFLPKHIVTIPVMGYVPGTTYKQIKMKEKYT